MEIDTLLARFQKNYFWRPFWFFSKTRFSIFPEVTDWFCWFWIAIIWRQLCTLCSILKEIEDKLRPWECRNEKNVHNGSHDVILFEFSKSVKKVTGKFFFFFFKLYWTFQTNVVKYIKNKNKEFLMTMFLQNMNKVKLIKWQNKSYCENLFQNKNVSNTILLT